MKHSTRFSLAVALAVLVSLAACNNGGNSNPPAPGPTCALPSGTQTVLVYPAPNATAVPDAFGQVILGSTAALPASWQVVLTSALYPNGVSGADVQSASPPFPTPNATPSFANPVYQSSNFSGAGSTFAGQVVSVYLNDTSSATCTPLGPIGSFTTQ